MRETCPFSGIQGCPLFRSYKCIASMGIAVGTSTVVCYTVCVRYWECPLSDVPLFVKNFDVATMDYGDPKFFLVILDQGGGSENNSTSMPVPGDKINYSRNVPLMSRIPCVRYWECPLSDVPLYAKNFDVATMDLWRSKVLSCHFRSRRRFRKQFHFYACSR